MLRGGIDLGGTKVQAIVVDEDHRVVGESRHETPTEGGADAVVEALAAAMREAADAAGVPTSELEGVGIGSPGDADDAAGTIANAGNLTGFDRAVPVAAQLRERLGTEQVRLGNDVSVATDRQSVV